MEVEKIQRKKSSSKKNKKKSLRNSSLIGGVLSSKSLFKNFDQFIIGIFMLFAESIKKIPITEKMASLTAYDCPGLKHVMSL